MNLFERATRAKLRFGTNIGLITSEDLFDLSLQQLDKLAQELHVKVKDEGVSFIDAPNKSQAVIDDNLRFDIVKHVIESKLGDVKRFEKAAAQRAKRQRILELMEQKQDQDLEGKSLEELQALLDGDDEDED